MIDDENVPAYDGSLAEDSPWLTTSEVMELLNVSRSTVANYRKRGRIKAYLVGLCSVRYKLADIEDLINEANTIKRL